MEKHRMKIGSSDMFSEITNKYSNLGVLTKFTPVLSKKRVKYQTEWLNLVYTLPFMVIKSKVISLQKTKNIIKPIELNIFLEPTFLLKHYIPILDFDKRNFKIFKEKQGFISHLSRFLNKIHSINRLINKSLFKKIDKSVITKDGQITTENHLFFTQLFPENIWKLEWPVLKQVNYADQINNQINNLKAEIKYELKSFSDFEQAEETIYPFEINYRHFIQTRRFVENKSISKLEKINLSNLNTFNQLMNQITQLKNTPNELGQNDSVYDNNTYNSSEFLDASNFNIKGLNVNSKMNLNDSTYFKRFKRFKLVNKELRVTKDTLHLITPHISKILYKSLKPDEFIDKTYNTIRTSFNNRLKNANASKLTNKALYYTYPKMEHFKSIQTEIIKENAREKEQTSEELPKVSQALQASQTTQIPEIVLNRIVDQVYTSIERRIRIEKERRGLFG